MNESIRNSLMKDWKATNEEIEELLSLMEVLKKAAEKNRDDEISDNKPSEVIEDLLYHGDLGHACNMDLLKSLDVKRILNVCDCQLDESSNENFNILWQSIDDDSSEDIERHFEETNRFLDESRQTNEKVLVHCQMGISRSSTIVLAYLMKHHRMTLAQALEFLLERRSCASPNKGFLLQLIRYEKKLKQDENQKQSATEKTRETVQ